jgi:hypothetical protein
MIITQLTGGLGNQLFQYAAGKSLALHHQTDLKFDLSHFQLHNSRSFGLNQFRMQVLEASDEERKRLIPGSDIRKITERLKQAHKRQVYREPFFHYDTNFFSAKSDVYLKGNWQSEKYFKPFQEQIRKDFTIKDELITHLQSFANKLRCESSVSVHIRRGDYLQPSTLAYHGVLSDTYYTKAMALFMEKNSQHKFYVFTDDVAWVKNNLVLPEHHEFVSGMVSTSAIEDFFLMQSCRHNIIANSSFSWWAAWLNDHSDKIVISPKAWFDKGPQDTYDLIPLGWIQI